MEGKSLTGHSGFNIMFANCWIKEKSTLKSFTSFFSKSSSHRVVFLEKLLFCQNVDFAKKTKRKWKVLSFHEINFTHFSIIFSRDTVFYVFSLVWKAENILELAGCLVVLSFKLPLINFSWKLLTISAEIQNWTKNFRKLILKTLHVFLKLERYELGYTCLSCCGFETFLSKCSKISLPYRPQKKVSFVFSRRTYFQKQLSTF